MKKGRSRKEEVGRKKEERRKKEGKKRLRARLHRVEKHYEYSYRLLCVTQLNWQIR